MPGQHSLVPVSILQEFVTWCFWTVDDATLSNLQLWHMHDIILWSRLLSIVRFVYYKCLGMYVGS